MLKGLASGPAAYIPPILPPAPALAAAGGAQVQIGDINVTVMVSSDQAGSAREIAQTTATSIRDELRDLLDDTVSRIAR